MAMATSTCLSPSASNSSISSSTCAKADGANSDSFPAGLRVLVVDDDPICLLILDRMLRHCQYQVTSCGRATEALALLRENRNNFDVILSDVYMPDMDGFKLLELVGLEMDLPVIMMSANGETSAVMKGIKHGACDYLLKPVRMEELRNLWQHVVRKKWRSSGQTVSHEVDKSRQVIDEGEYNSSGNEGLDGTWKQSKKRKDIKEEEEEVDLDNDDPSSTKKPRVVWSVELHQQFVNAVNQLGIDKAVPKRILELMNVLGLTRENVASHLQKYRLYLKRISSVAHQSGGLNSAFSVMTDSNFGPVSGAGLTGLSDLQTLTRPSPQSLVSTLQAGILGRLNPASVGTGNMDPSVLLRIAALQGAGNGGIASLPSCGQTMLNFQGSFQAGPLDVNLLQVSQLGPFMGPLDKGPPGLSAVQQQQQQLATMANVGDLGLPGVNNSQQVNANPNPFFMQTLQQQVGGHLMNKAGLLMSTTGMGVQHGLSPDVDSWSSSTLNAHAAGITIQNSGSLRSLSVPSLSGTSASVGPMGRATDSESKGLQNIAGLSPTMVSSPLASCVVDELSAARLKDIGSSNLASNEGLRQNYGSKFALFSGLKQDQEFRTGQRMEGPWQTFNLSQDYGRLNDHSTQSHRYNQSFPGCQNLVSGMAQDQSCVPDLGFGTEFSATFAVDNARSKPFQMSALQGEHSRVNLKVKQEGTSWLHEPLSDELLTIVLKQQQENLAESELGGVDGYTMDNMYVK